MADNLSRNLKSRVGCHCWENKRAAPDVPAFRSPRVARTPGDAAWRKIPFVATRDAIPVVIPQDHFCLVSTSVTADVQMAHNGDSLYLRVRTYDDRLDRARPTGLIQFTVRDEDPGVDEWPYFFNSYALFNLFMSDRGPMFLRYDPLYVDRYPAGVVRAADVSVKARKDGMLFTARIPWSELGPCRPGRHNPFYMMFTFNRADNLLDVPRGDTPEEWSHNFADNFIVKKPALARRVTFD